MILNVKEFVDFLAEHKITAEEFLFLYLTYRREYASMYKYVECVRGFNKDMIGKLEDRGIIINLNDRGKYFADSFEVDESFAEKAFSRFMEEEDAFDAMANEFWEAYPSYLYIDGHKIPAKNWDKLEFEKFYKAKIRKRKDIHERIMAALRWQTETTGSEINMGLEKWLKTNQYAEIEKEMTNSSSISNQEEYK